MSKPSVEEIVAEIEAVMAGMPPSEPDHLAGLSDDKERVVVLKLPVVRALIASWRERGEALEETAKQKLVSEMADADEPTYGDVEIGYEECVKRARAALKDKP